MMDEEEVRQPRPSTPTSPVLVYVPMQAALATPAGAPQQQPPPSPPPLPPLESALVSLSGGLAVVLWFKLVSQSECAGLSRLPMCALPRRFPLPGLSTAFTARPAPPCPDAGRGGGRG